MSEEKLMDVHEAVKYLANKWGMEQYSAPSFHSHAKRWNVQPALASATATFWRRSDLDRLPKPVRGRKKRQSREPDDSEPVPAIA